MKSHPIHPSSLLKSILFERLAKRVFVLTISLVAAILAVFAPFAQKNFVDGLLAGSPSAHWIAWAFVLTLGAQCLVQVAVWLAMRESFISQKSMGEAAYSRILEGPGGLIGNRPAGEAVSLFAVDVPGAAFLLADSLAMSASMLFPIVIAPVALQIHFGIPWTTSVLAFLVLLALNFALAVRQSRFFIHFKRLAAERTGLVAEWVQNIRTLRILGWVPSAEERIFEVRRRETRNRKSMVSNGQLMNSIASTSTFVLNILAILYVFRLREAQAASPPTPGELLSLLWILGVFLSKPLRQLPWVFVISMDAISSARRLQDALRVPIVQPQILGPGPTGGTAAGAALEIQGLSLESGGRKLLNDIDLTLREGELVAIVGEVGSGKSLLLQSLIGATGARFRRFAIRGRETRGPAEAGVRERFSFVPQEGFTMSATLRENVLFEYLDADARIGDEQSRRVLDSLGDAQFVPERERVLDGLDTEIGERGVNLSGGQRQRIGLARARYAERPFVLLDDCLSAVDVDTEKRLLDALIRGHWRDRTRVLVTHRMSVLPACDRILFMEDGTIAMEGTYSQLLEGSPRFREFVSKERAAADGS